MGMLSDGVGPSLEGEAGGDPPPSHTRVHEHIHSIPPPVYFSLLPGDLPLHLKNFFFWQTPLPT